MGTARIVTDAGPAYIKALGNRQGPHPLACEWVATHLAHWLGLPTFDKVFMEDVDDGSGSRKSRLVAMDHTHCFTCGRDLDDRVAYIDKVNDDRLYGLFPGFKPSVRQEELLGLDGAVAQLGSGFLLAQRAPHKSDAPGLGSRGIRELAMGYTGSVLGSHADTKNVITCHPIRVRKMGLSPSFRTRTRARARARARSTRCPRSAFGHRSHAEAWERYNRRTE